MQTLDSNWVRQQFPAFSDPELEGFVHAENAGGSYACNAVIEQLEHFYRANKMQPYYPSAPSTAGGEAMSRARMRLAQWLGVKDQELQLGPSTTQNTYVLAQALRQYLQPGDEVVVSAQDHEANVGALHRLAEAGFTVREWQVDPHSGELSEAGLHAVMTERTRVVAFTHCSNVVASINPVPQWCQKIRAAGALSIVDGVSYAPHGLPQVPRLGADIYLFSLYKVYGPHLGVMTMRQEWNERLPNQGHFFNADKPSARFTPAGPDHAQVAAVNGVVDYFEALHRHHFAGADEAQAPARVHELLRAQEKALTQPLLDFVQSHPRLHLIGQDQAEHRAPTVSMTVTGTSPQALCEALAAQGIGTGYGNFYAWRLMEGLQIDPDEGVLRCSFVHYNTEDEVERLKATLEQLLAA
ncbi:MAG: aminotransferase class V-fold PLP-dependent enzyme [Xanthomonadales bacterium]|nr:aminotransferase class V-fold PLP-dependent enzyme [Xanthomonadales bacterium]